MERPAKQLTINLRANVQVQELVPEISEPLTDRSGNNNQNWPVNQHTSLQHVTTVEFQGSACFMSWVMVAVCKKNVNQTGRVCNVIGDSQTKSLITMLSCHVSGGEYYIIYIDHLTQIIL